MQTRLSDVVDELTVLWLSLLYTKREHGKEVIVLISFSSVAFFVPPSGDTRRADEVQVWRAA